MSEMTVQMHLRARHSRCSQPGAMRSWSTAGLLGSMLVFALVPASSRAMPPGAPAPVAPGAAKADEPARKPTASAALEVPAFDEDFAAFPVARVAGETITLRQLMEGLATSHEDRKVGVATKSDFLAVLNRVIDVKLFVLEARAAGLDEEPKYIQDLATFKTMTARSLVEEQATKDAAPDPAQVEAIFKDAVREWKIRSLLFDTEQGAKDFLAQVKAGQRFEDAVKKALEEKKGKGSGEVGEFIPVATLQGPVKDAIVAMGKGDVSPPLRVKEGWTVLRLEEDRYPENAAARAKAEAESRTNRAADALREFHAALHKKYVKKFDRKLLDRIDYHAKRPGFDAYLKDRRTIVTVEGEPPITVAELTKEIQGNYFHGMEEPLKDKSVNPRKVPVLALMVYKRLFDHEARLRRMNETLAFRRAVEDFESGRLFAAYLEKAIAPSVTLTEEDFKAYYEANAKEFSTPSFYTIDGIGFGSAPAAQAALERLKGGTDFKWLKQNADGQVDAGKRDPDLEGKTLIQSSMPPELAKVLEGTSAGDLRLYPARNGVSYVLVVSNHVPAKVRPYAEVRESIRKVVFGRKMQAAVDEWAGKLRKGYDVEVFIKRIGS